MNRNLYRIVFNVKRGQLMAVAETASAQGKTAGETRGGPSGGLLSGMRPVCFAVLAALGLAAPLTQAQIVADPNAPGSQRSTILRAANGVALINIPTPAPNGMSIAAFSDYNVSNSGVILNNSRTNIQTQLGGFVAGNPKLATGSATSILVQVNGNNPTNLNGPTEIAGPRTQLIVANPSGIWINGASFLNTSNVTLTTGTPVYNGSGDIDSYRVQGGTVRIEGLGLDASTTDRTDILARALVVNAGIWANRLRVTTGANDISAADPSSATPIAGTGPKPTFMLDMGLFGGMYSNLAHIVGTEYGVGANLSGFIGATAGDAVIQSNGWIGNKGTIQAQGNAQVNAVGPVSNTGTVFANGNASVTSQDSVTNTGTVYAQGNTGITAQTSVSNSGTIQALGTTNVTAQSGINNSGTVYAQGTTAVTSPGNISNTGVMAAQGNTTVQATGAGASVSSAVGSVMAAGLNPDGTLATAGNLNVTAAGAANLNGQSVAAGNVNIAGTQASVADGQLSAQNITVTASTGNVDASRASVTTQGTLTANATQTLRTDGAAVSANQLALGAHDLSNVSGEIIQMGTGNTAITVAGTIDNTSGRIGTNSQNLTLAANTLTNTDGKLEHAGAGTLALTANTFNDQRGQTTSSGALTLNAGTVNHDSASTIAAQVTVNAGSLNNHAGEIIQTGTGATSITTTGALDNSAGTIASNGNTSVSAQSLNNQGGRVQSANTSSLTVATTGALDNSASGQVTAGGSATVNAGTLNNNQGKVTAGTTVTATVAGTATNTQGLIAANGATAVTAASLDNTRGTVASVQNNVSVTTTGATTNDSGRIEALGSTTLTNGGLSNTKAAGQATAGSITGNTVNIQTNGQALNNAQGTIAAVQGATLQTGALNNDRGLVQAGGALTVNTHGQTLTNTDAAGYASGAGGISSQGTMALDTGALNNASGFVGAKQALTANTGQVSNTAGAQIVGESTVNVTGTGFDNQSGQVQALGNVTIAAGAGTVNNTGGLVRSAATTTLSGANVTNSNTLGANQGIEGHNVAINANTVANDSGAIRTDVNTTVTSSGSLNNTNGLVSAGDTATVQDTASNRTLAINNSGGTLAAGRSMAASAASLSGAGSLLSQQDLSLSLSGDFNNTGTLSAARNNTVNVAGTLTNSGKMQAGDTLDVTAATIDNTATGELTGTTTRITATAANTLINRGLIDGVNTEINGVTVNNIGTGRIYGTNLSIAATTINNIAETVNGVTTAATIAARQRLDIGATTVNNNNGALIFSGGTGANALNIGGALDASRRAIGRAGAINNSGATIESLGAANISAGQVNNTNPNFSYILQGGGAGSGPVREFVTGSGTFSNADGAWSLGTDALTWIPQGGGIFLGATPGSLVGRSPTGQALVIPQGTTFSAPLYQRMFNTPDVVLNGVIYLVAVVPPDPSVWALFGLAVPTGSPPVGPKPVGYCPGTNCGNGDNSDATYVDPDPAEVAAWEAAAAPWRALQAAIDGARATIAATAIPVEGFRDYTGAAQTAVVTQSTPGRMLSSGAMALNASNALVNDQSQIIAGGALNVTGQAVDNRGRTISVNAQRTGTAYFWSNYNEGCGGWDGCDYNYDAYRAAPYVQDVPQTITLNVARSQSTLSPASQGLASGTELGSANTVHVNPTIAAPGAATAAARNAGIVQVTSAVAGVGAVTGSTPVVRTFAPNFTLPTASLFHANVNPSPTANYIIETDPRFANYRNWLSSDYMLQALSLDPNVTQKRLGDGFYEQRLVNEQVAQLTGQRFLAGYANEEAQYKALMDAGTTFAQQYQLRPGISLSAQQMAQLTSDIVWLVEQTVTLADGSTTRALVPQVYARVKAGDLDGTGTLLAGQVTNLNLTGDMTNTGTVAGRTIVNLTAENVNNLGGRISANNATVVARNDLNNIGGTIDAADNLTAVAGRDLNVVSTTSSASNQTSGTSNNSFSHTGIDRVAGLYVTSQTGATLVASAGRDANLIAGIIANNGAAGNTTVNATRDLNLGTVGTSSSSSLVRGAGTDFLEDRQTADVGSQVNTQGNLNLSAGRDLNTKAASVQATGDLTATAGNNVNITNGQQTNSTRFGLTSSESDLFSSTSTTERRSGDQTNAVGSSIGGKTVTAIAGNNLGITGSNVISDAGTALAAGNNLTVQSATNTTKSSDFKETKEEGLMSSGGLGVTIGSLEQSTDQKTSGTTAAASTVGSIGGNVSLQAGNAYKQVGSDVMAPNGNIDITAKKVDIVEARETSQTVVEQKFKQEGLTFEVVSPVISAIQSAQQMSEAAGNTSDDRMKGLAAANTAFAAKKAADAIQKGQGTNINGKEGQIPTKVDGDGKVLESRDANAADKAGGIDLAISIGGSENQSRQENQSDTARGSSINAAGNVSIIATGAGKDSNLTIQGSTVEAGNSVQLSADNEVKLLAAKNTTSQNSTNSSSSSSVGISYGTNGLMFNASGSKGSGKADGTDTSNTNTEVRAGNQAALTSGGNTTLEGALVKADQIKADVGGDLKIESPQDTSTYTSEQKNASASVSIGYGNGSASVSASKSNINSDFKSVGEQSGLKAGDGGFQVKVEGNTALTGGVISSNQAAVDQGKNSFQTGGTLTTTDLQNTASYEGKASGFSLGGGPVADIKGITGLGIGLGSDKKDASSTTSAGISGIAGNTAVRSTDAETGLKPIFDADKVQREIDAQVQITQAFTRDATKAVGDFAQGKINEAKDLRNRAATVQDQDPERAAALNNQAQALEDTWGEGKTGRVLLHTLVGGLAGGLSGAAGAGTSQSLVPLLGEQIAQMDIPPEMKSALIAAAGTAIGAATGGTAGAISGLTATVNNYLSHPESVALSNAQKRLAACTDTACRTNEQRTIDALLLTSFERDVALQNACTSAPSGATCKSLTADAKAAYESYSGKPGVILDRTVSEQSALARRAFYYPTLAAGGEFTPKTTGVINGTLKALAAGPAGLLIVSTTAANAITGDEQARQALKQMVIDAAVTLTNIPAAIQKQLDAANAAEAIGDVQKAAEIRAELATNTVLVSGAITKVALSSGVKSVFKQGDRVLTPSEMVAAGPVNFMGDSDQFYKNALKRVDIDPNGTFDVVAHGSTQKIEFMTANGPVLVDQRVASKLIEASPGYNGQSIRLISCDTGACDTGFAQSLANKMGVSVQAPTDLVWSYGNGKMVVAPRLSSDLNSPLFNYPDLSKQGTFRTFRPGNSQ
jgi:filamentous hemagglutinin